MSRLATLQTSYDEVRSTIEKIERSASEAARDLTDDEQAETDTLVKRATELAEQIKTEGAKLDQAASVAEIVARHGGKVERSANAAAPKDLAEWYAAQHFNLTGKGTIDRAVAEQVTSDVEVPPVYVNEVLNISDFRRPVFDSFRHPQFIEAMNYTTARVTQHVNVGKQVNQHDELASRRYQAELETWATETWGGTLNVPRQVVDLQPTSVYADIVNDFRNVYLEETEQRACEFLASAAGSASVGWTSTSIGSIVTSVTNGISALYATGKKAPNTLWLSLDQTLAVVNKFNDDDSVSALERLNKSLEAAGFDLNIVTGFQLPANTRILGNSNEIAVRERILGLLSAPVVSHLEVVIAYAGYLQFSHDPEFLVKLV